MESDTSTSIADSESPPAGLQRLHPSVRLVWWVQSGLVALPLFIAALVGELVADVPWPRGLLTLVVLLIAGGLAVAIPVVRYRNWGYALREDDLEIRSGVFWRKVTLIPYIRLQFVDTRQGPIERMLGLSELVVHTAAVGTSGRLPGLSTRAATTLRERLSQLEGDTGGL